MAQSLKYVKIHSLCTEKGRDLNDRTGKLGAWQKGKDRYQVHVGHNCYALKIAKLYSVNESWVYEVSRMPFRKRIDDMASKFHAPGLHPCPISELQVSPTHYGGPGTTRQQVQSWWGSDVFRYIRQGMDVQSQKRGTFVMVDGGNFLIFCKDFGASPL